jgi:phage shock protein A
MIAKWEPSHTRKRSRMYGLYMRAHKGNLAVRFGDNLHLSSLITAGKERSQTMKKMLILICMVALGFLLALSAFGNNTQQSAELKNVKAELEQLKAALEKTGCERDNLEAEVAEVRQAREQLQKKVNVLTDSCEQWQRQVEKLNFSSDQSRQQLAEIIDTRDKLKKQVVELASSRDKLRQQNDELAASNSRLNRQVKELSESRDEAVAKTLTAQKRIVAVPDSGKQEFNRQQEGLAVTNKAPDDNEPPMVEITGFHAAVTKVGRPAVIPARLIECPTCHSFKTTRSRIMPGQTSILSWQVSDADRIRIEPAIGSVSALGSVAVKPSTATAYTLIATNKAGESRVSCTIEVVKGPALGSDIIGPRRSFEKDVASEDNKVVSGQKPQVGEPDKKSGKLLGYRAVKDKSGKFIFIPVYQSKPEE